MAKTSVVNRNKRRERLVACKREQREKIKSIWLDNNCSEEERRSAYLRLQRMPRDSSPVRVRIRCALTGRPRGVFRHFGISRTKLREMIMNGEVPGVTKSSW